MQKRLQKIVDKALEEKIFSASSLILGDEKKILWTGDYGKINFKKNSKKTSRQSIFDLASLTKAIATSLAVFLLIEKKQLSLDTLLANFFVEFQKNPKDKITIYHLLNHTSGLPDWAPLFEQGSKEKALQKLLNMDLQNAVGSKVVYSCLGFILLGQVIRKITGNYQEFCNTNFFDKLGLKNTHFHPLSQVFIDKQSSIVSCYKENIIKKTWQRTYALVQDANCRIFEGQSANSGLFSNADDIYLIAKTLLNNYQEKGVQLLQKKSVAKMWQLSTAKKTPHWALGWVCFQGRKDWCHCPKNMELGTIGHLGYSGAGLMIEPQRGRIYVILTNRLGSKKTAVAMKKFRLQVLEILTQFDNFSRL